MARPAKFTPEERKAVINLLLVNKVSVELVARRFDCSKMTIIRVRQEYFAAEDSRKTLNRDDGGESHAHVKRNGKTSAGRSCPA
jgi:transposase-like protein